MKKILVFLLLILSAWVSNAQIKYFSQDTSVYIKEFKEFMLKDNIRPEAKDDWEKFYQVWSKHLFNEDEKRNILRVCNRMMIENMRNDNEFTTLTNLLVYLKKTNYEEEKYTAWFKMMEGQLNSDPIQYKEFLEFSTGLFEKNALMITPQRTWLFVAEDYDFSFKSEPILTFPELDLYCITAGDTIHIGNTKGTYLPRSKSWKGTGGRSDWRRCEMDTDEVYIKLGKYSINMAKAEFKADTVVYHNSIYFKSPLKGSFEDKASSSYEGARSDYPRFSAFDQKLTIRNIAENVHYKGGFKHQGGKYIFAGSDTIQSALEFIYKGDVRARVYAKEFYLRKDILTGQECKVSLYIRDSTAKTDSIYHPEVKFSYNSGEKLLTVMRGDKGITQTPFRDSYHKLEMKPDVIYWKMDVPRYDLKMINPEAKAIFESKDYYRNYRFEEIQGLLDYNPIESMRNFCMKRKNGSFTLQEYADYMKNKKEYLIGQMLLLNDKGFLTYDPKTEKAEVNMKLFHYYNSYKGTEDFDVLEYESVISARSNGVIDFISNDLTLEGVPAIQFSDSQNVFAKFSNQTLTIQKNRNMRFDGRVHAGRFDFYGKGFYFDYNGFLIKMDNVDSMRFVAPSRDNPEKMVLVQTVLQNIYGTLYIDKENNKSGLKDYPEYPKFVSDRGAMVYYDRPDIFGGVYNREEFYFKTDPFTINSLDKFKLEDIRLEGTFVSGNIVPDFQYVLTVQKDYSLGFIKPIEPEGMSMYGGKGRNYGSLSLSNEGFWGSGKIEYLNSVGNAKAYVMFLDSTNGEFEDYNITRTGTVPEVKGWDVHLHWEPKNDRMFASSKSTPLVMFGGKAMLEGTTILSPNILGGNGNLNFDNAVLNSADFLFRPMAATAEVGNLNIKAVVDTTQLSFVANDVKANVNFESRIGEFKANNPGLNTGFPYNQYLCNLNDFTWDIDKKSIDLRKPAEQTAEETIFMSIKPGQDNLLFQAGSANFNLKTNVLDIKDVPYIAVCDAHIFPDKKNVIIDVDAVMRPLPNSKVICDSIGETHTLYNTTMQVLGRFKMEGNGMYDFYDQYKRKQSIYFYTITDDRKGRTMATAKVGDSVLFYPGPRIAFKGDLHLYSMQTDLEYDGLIKPEHFLPLPKTDWIRYKMRINADSVILVHSTPRTDSKVELFSGFYLSNDSTHMYPALATRKYFYADADVFTAHGAMYFDSTKEEFVIIDSNRWLNPTKNGNKFTYSDTRKEAIGEGKINLGGKLGEIKMTGAGTITQSLGDSMTTQINMALLIDFPFPKKALDMMIDSIIEDNAKSRPTRYVKESTFRNLSEILDDPEKLYRLKKKLKEDNKFTMYDEFEKLFFFSDFDLEWRSNNRRYWASGEMGLQALGKKQIGKQVNVKMVLEKRRSGDVLQLLITTREGGYYYFNYSKGTMGVLSSDKAFMEAFAKESVKSSKLDFRLRSATPKQMANFLKGLDK